MHRTFHTLSTHRAVTNNSSVRREKDYLSKGGGGDIGSVVLGVTLLLLQYVCLGADFLISAAAVECVYENLRHDPRFIRNAGPH